MPVRTSIVKATDTTEYVAALPPGEKSPYRFEYPTNGFNTVVTRTVKDSTGAVIHSDTWYSKYGVVNGLLAYKGTPPPSKSPPPTPGPATPPPTVPRRAHPPPPTAAPTTAHARGHVHSGLLPLTFLPLLVLMVPVLRRRRLLRK